MSQKELNQVNKVYHAIVTIISVCLAICAIIYNPAHLFSASIIYALGSNAEFVKADEFDLRK